MPSSPPPAVRRSRRLEEIVDAAAGLFARHGYAETGITEIGEAVGLARGALYYHIGSKESLLVEIHDRVMDPLLHEARAAASLDVDAATKVRLISEVLLRQIVDRPDHCRVFLHEYRSITGKDRSVFRKKRAAFEQLITGALAEGVAGKMFSIVDIRITLLAFLGMHNYTYQWLHTTAVSHESLSEIYCDIFLGGIADREFVARSTAGMAQARVLLAEALAALPFEPPLTSSAKARGQGGREPNRKLRSKASKWHAS